jgi:hypothetical protein
MFVTSPISNSLPFARRFPAPDARPGPPPRGQRLGPHVRLLALALATVERTGEALATLKLGLRASPTAGPRCMVRRRPPARTVQLSSEV